jgi:hypothetical protein
MMTREEKKVGIPKRYRKPNALKHGGFSRMELFPWENSAEFERLHRDLIEQYHPRGPLQEDCIQAITSLMWRKRRIRDKRLFDVQAALERTENRVLWEHPAPLMETDFDLTKYQLKNRSSGQQARARDRVTTSRSRPSSGWRLAISAICSGRTNMPLRGSNGRY